MRTAHAPERATHVFNTAGGSLARRWYYTPKSQRAYSVRQIALGDRRLLAEFALSLGQATTDADIHSVRTLSDLLFDRVLGAADHMAAGFVALESTAAGDRVIGVAALAPIEDEAATFHVAVASAYRGEQVGRILLGTLVRHARRAGVRRLSADMAWSNRPMQLLAQATGFSIDAVAGDRSRRSLMLLLK